MKTYRIVVVDKDEDFGIKVTEIFEGWKNINCEVRWFTSLVVEELHDTNCIIVDSRLVKDVKNFIEIIYALGIKKIVLATNELNHPHSVTAIDMGAMLFYRFSPITTLLYKIFNISSGDTESIKLANKDASSNSHNNTPQRRNVVFFSPKGGTGKSSLAINLAIQFASKNVRVLLVDFAVFGNIGVKLQIPNPQKGFNTIFSSLKSGGGKFTKLDNLMRNNITTYSRNKIKFDVLPCDFPINMLKVDIESIQYLNTKISELDYDIVLIDTSSQHSKLNSFLFSNATDIVVLATPDSASTWNLIHNVEIMRSLNCDKKCSLVINMFMDDINFVQKEIETEMPYPLISTIPNYQRIRLLENIGDFISFYPNDPMNSYYRQVGHHLLQVFRHDEILPENKVASSGSGFSLLKKIELLKKKVQNNK